MLWYRCWLETRWRFFIGLALLTLGAAGIVMEYPKVVQLMPLAQSADIGGVLGREIRESAELAREYRGYIWGQWFRQNLAEMWTIFAVLLGTGGLLSNHSGRASLFTLSLPVSRRRLLGARAAAGLGELLVLAVIPSLAIPLLSPTVGQTYSVGNALIHSACTFVAGTVFFSLAFLLSTVFTDFWRPMLIALCAAVLLGLCGQLVHDLSRYTIFGVMNAEMYFRTGALPWLGLLVSMALSSAMLYGAAINIDRQDF